MFKSLIVRAVLDYARFFFLSPEATTRKYLETAVKRSTNKVDDVMLVMVTSALDNKKVTRQRAQVLAYGGRAKPKKA